MCEMLLSISPMRNVSWVTGQRGTISCKVANLIPVVCGCYWHHFALLCVSLIYAANGCVIQCCYLCSYVENYFATWLFLHCWVVLYLCGWGGALGMMNKELNMTLNKCQVLPKHTFLMNLINQCFVHKTLASVMNRTFWTWNWHHFISGTRLQLDSCQLDISLGKKVMCLQVLTL